MESIYLDHAATTPVREEVREAMAPYLGEVFGNPSSLHRWGREASAALEDARASAAESLGARASEIRFVRGGTESDNLALVGRVEQLRGNGSPPTLVVSSVEHRAVLDAAHNLAASGRAVLRVLDVAPDGTVDLPGLREALDGEPCVVSVMWVNNETGIVLPLPEIAEAVRQAERGTLHTDAVQAVGKLDVRLDQVPIDLLTVTGHKIYGPKGTGLLFVRTGVEVTPLLRGGGQERALRPGTEDVAGAVGLATALRLAIGERQTEESRLAGLRDSLEASIRSRLTEVRVNGGDAERAPHVASLGIGGVDGHALVVALDLEGVAVSGGSACASGSGAGSHVIAALYGSDDARGTVRFSLGRATRVEHVERAADVCVRVVERLRDAGASA